MNSQNEDGIINSLSIRNKTKLPITVQRSQEIGNLYLVETVELPGNVLSTSSLSTSNKFSSSYFFVSSSLNFSSLFLNLDECEQKLWICLLEKWSTVLSMSKYNVSLTKVDYMIRLSDTTPIKSSITCYSQGVREAIGKELEKMKEADFIEPYISSFAATMVCV